MAESSSEIELGYSKNFPEKIGLRGRMIINGEIHHVKSNPVIKFQLLKALHKNNQVRYLIMESGPAFGYLYNQYLRSGDESLLDWNPYIKFEIDFWRNFKQFNDSLPSNDKIQVLAFDFDQPHAYEKTIKMIFRTVSSEQPRLKSALAELMAIVNGIEKLENIPAGNKVISNLLMSKNRGLLDQIGRDTLTLQMMVANGVPFTSKTKRDRNTYVNIRNFLKYFTNGNFFAEYGISHVNRSAHHLAYFLNNNADSPVKENVTCILPEYVNCVSGYKETPINMGILSIKNVKVTGIEDVTKSVTLFALDKKKKSLARLIASGEYVLLIKNQ